MKTVIITGANRGIGKATAEKFLKERWNVIGTSTNGVGWGQDHLTWFKLDLRDYKSIGKIITELHNHKQIDVLINNAAIWPDEEDRKHPTVSAQVLRKVLEVNLVGTIELTERILASKLMAKSGHIISMGSGSGVICNNVSDDVPSYRISKVALSMYTRTLAKRLESTEITVSILDPGWVRTDMGGEDAPRLPEEAANDYFELATSEVPTGKFWKEGQERSW